MNTNRLENAVDYREVVTFRIAEQDYCFDLKSVREIRGWTDTTKLPHAQEYVKGVINLRGSVVPVIDLSERLGLGPTEPGARHVIIIAVVGSRTVGLLADVVSDILTISDTEIHPIPDIIDDVVKSFVAGVLIIDERMIRMMNLDRVIPEQVGEAA